MLWTALCAEIECSIRHRRCRLRLSVVLLLTHYYVSRLGRPYLPFITLLKISLTCLIIMYTLSKTKFTKHSLMHFSLLKSVSPLTNFFPFPMH